MWKDKLSNFIEKNISPDIATLFILEPEIINYVLYPFLDYFSCSRELFNAEIELSIPLFLPREEINLCLNSPYIAGSIKINLNCLSLTIPDFQTKKQEFQERLMQVLKEFAIIKKHLEKNKPLPPDTSFNFKTLIRGSSFYASIIQLIRNQIYKLTKTFFKNKFSKVKDLSKIKIDNKEDLIFVLTPIKKYFSFLEDDKNLTLLISPLDTRILIDTSDITPSIYVVDPSPIPLHSFEKFRQNIMQDFSVFFRRLSKVLEI